MTLRVTLRYGGADIKSADFTGANLRGANFSGAVAGLQKRWAAFLVAVSWAVAAVSGLFSAFFGSLAVSIFNTSNLGNQIAGLIDISDNYQSFYVTSFLGENSSIPNQLIYTIKSGFEIFLMKNNTKTYGYLRSF